MRLSIGVEFDGAYRSVGAIVTKPGIGASSRWLLRTIWFRRRFILN